VEEIVHVLNDLAMWRNGQKSCAAEKELSRLPRRSMLLKGWFKQPEA
jgi:hypothetical protein